MPEVLTSAQMRDIENAAIASGGVTGTQLMERAGAAVVQAILAQWPEFCEGCPKATVLCGPGNNGGDGFVVARLLRLRGWRVRVLLLGDARKLPPDARAKHDLWREIGDVDALCKETSLRNTPDDDTDLYVDAVFGSGLSRSLNEVLSEDVFGVLSRSAPGAETFRASQSYRVVAVDVPSGLCADSGRPILADGQNGTPPEWICTADLTVTFERMKRGHILATGPRYCGKVVVAPLGTGVAGPGCPGPAARAGQHPASAVTVQQVHIGSGGKDLASGIDSRRLDKGFGTAGRAENAGRADNKFGYGHALILSGPAGYGGAARLAARAALRIGAGLVTIGAPAEALAEHAAQINAVMLRGAGGAAALTAMLADRRINALCLGPGLGVDARAEGLVEAALAIPAPGSAQARRAVVLDADALTLMAHNPALFVRLNENCVLTPHGGEFARLFPDIAAKLDAPATKGPAYSRVDATCEAAARAGCTVLLKGPDTIIADAAGRCAVNASVYDRAAPWLATAGSGDTLAGFITGLLARGFPAFDATCAVAWLHTECAISFGPGLIAEDLPEALPEVLRRLLQ